MTEEYLAILNAISDLREDFNTQIDELQEIIRNMGETLGRQIAEMSDFISDKTDELQAKNDADQEAPLELLEENEADDQDIRERLEKSNVTNKATIERSDKEEVDDQGISERLDQIEKKQDALEKRMDKLVAAQERNLAKMEVLVDSNMEIQTDIRLLNKHTKVSTQDLLAHTG